MKKTNLKLICGVSLIVLTAFLSGCNRSPSNQTNGAAGCSTNPYLMKYGCSVERIQTAAEAGNPDAQYALGYMYYYGIDTVRDKPTAELWIQRSAAQGQPLAQKAWSLINSGATFTDLHQAASGTQNTPSSSSSSDVIQQQPPTDVSKLNAIKPSAPISNYLPGYKSGNLTTGTAQDSKHDPVNDPRLASNAKPVAASAVTAAVTKPTQMASAVVAPPGSGFTIQLMGSDKMSDIKSYIGSHHLGDAANTYQTQLNGKPWYMLTYGHYKTQQEAMAALHALPKNLETNHPWVKSLGLIQKEVALQKVIA